MVVTFTRSFQSAAAVNGPYSDVTRNFASLLRISKASQSSAQFFRSKN
jgi:hypothetical protein